MVEIERKYLVKNHEFKKAAASSYMLKQGFLSRDPERTVRVRVLKEQGILTIKGKTDSTGTTRGEWEYTIPKTEAEQLLEICLPGIIEKERYRVPIGAHTFEVDVFFRDNDGLILAEIELLDQSEDFLKPEWLGREVTGIPAYYNSQLSKKPYTTWT